ncbi:unnamed protein product [Vitrella brassicaformis CCMP3155]|uniref:Uncharacterized protein n=1 Tax=Vitrella brassicaformis (strain CCMP3155) TaxID=1169540 RepID=A0A0G4EHA0_VITBC|nr:unnamed protein product [Vitrella brassicaformis CCMP3155]|eukprot:CEL95866.1 unnamed protein product [Vitrella brassicaformis CCMP3155]
MNGGTGGHPYAEGYKRADPAIRQGEWLNRSFSAFLLDRVLLWWSDGEGVEQKMVLWADIGRGDARYGRLLRTDNIPEDQGIAVDYRYDRGNIEDHRDVILIGFRLNETVAAHLRVGDGLVELYTTEPSAADRPHPLADRYSVSVGAARRLLWPFGLESAVIDRGECWDEGCRLAPGMVGAFNELGQGQWLHGCPCVCLCVR